MKLTLMIKLLPTNEQYRALLGTTEQFNNACNSISAIAFDSKSANKTNIQKQIFFLFVADIFIYL